MRKQLLTLAIGSGLLFAAGPGMADHNSKNGEGWANMPNDIHNTRVETLETGDNESFKEFVKNGEGSDSVNRFASDDTQPGQAKEQKGEAKAVKNEGDSRAKNENKSQVSRKDQKRMETRSRMRSNTMSRPDRGGSRRGGGRRGGGKG